MRISEIYVSKQGEGRLTEAPSVFIRTSGCNLRCDFCDTPFASWNPEGSNFSTSEIVEQALTLAEASPLKDVRHAVITGGEPMLSKEIVLLTEELKAAGFHITIETAGTIDQKVSCDLMSISPKMSNSTPTKERAGEWSEKHERDRRRPDIVSELISRFDYQLKFVVADPTDIDEILAYLNDLEDFDRAKVLLMPEGVTQAELKDREPWLLPLCETNGFQFCPRMHIEWYGNKRGT